MIYATIRKSAFWLEILDEEKILAVCVRGSWFKWHVYGPIRSDGKLDFYFGPYDSLGDAVLAFRTYKLKNKDWE